MSEPDSRRKNVLVEIAEKAMRDRGLQPDFSAPALQQLEQISHAAPDRETLRDLTQLLWCSIDNDDSRDLDQITVAEELGSNRVKILVGIADVDALVKIDSPIDRHAQANTTSVYTGVRTFPMLPPELSTDLTSLGENQIRSALVIEMVVDGEGLVHDSAIYRAKVKNRAKLAYSSVGAWLEGKGTLPKVAAAVPGMDNQLRVQDAVAQRMRRHRHEQGALELETIEPQAVVSDGEVVDLRREKKNRANDLIEDFMVGANGVAARYLGSQGYGMIRRIVKKPERWDRIVQVAKERGQTLPDLPDCRALADFLSRERKADPSHFPDLSLTIVKLLGRGEYVLVRAGETGPGHFGLAVRDYTHSTAPNRRFPDLITQRLLKAAFTRQPSPYSLAQLEFLAAHCTQRENDADRVERQVRKSAAALLLSHRIGDSFDAIVTGASPKGTWARLLLPPVEGKIVRGEHGFDVGDQVRVKLLSCDVQRGFIDLAAEPRGKP